MGEMMMVAGFLGREFALAGGRALVVGGTVRDLVLGLPLDGDLDVEVFGLDEWAVLDVLERVADGAVSACGQAFGVFKCTVGGVDVDVALPRREVKTGQGHRGFDVTVDPAATVEQAAARRHFTLGAMMFDPMTGEVVDPTGGRGDLRAGALRMVSSTAFSDDPLRPLVGMQLAARFGLAVEPETAAAARVAVAEFDTLPRDRLWHEWDKWARSSRPDLGLVALADMGWLGVFGLDGLVGCEQDAERHPEGDVWTHTLEVVRGVAGEGAGVVFAALLHDLGKVETTVMVGGHVHAFGHAERGAELAREFMVTVGAPKVLVERVVALVGAHMWHVSGASRRAVRRWSRRLGAAGATMGELVTLVRADSLGRGPGAVLPWQVEELARTVEEVGVADGPMVPVLMGRHLLALGMAPGPEMGALLAAAAEAQEAGVFDDLPGAMAWVEGRV